MCCLRGRRARARRLRGDAAGFQELHGVPDHSRQRLRPLRQLRPLPRRS